MKHWPIALVLFGLWHFSAAVAWGAPHPVITEAFNTTSLQAGQQAVLAVVVDIPPGLHAQSHTPVDPEHSVAFAIAMDPAPAVTVTSVRYPPGVLKDFPALGSLSIYKDRVIAYVPVAVKPDAAVGSLALSGNVTYQMCSDRVCYLEATLPFTVTTQIVAPGAAVTPNHPELFSGLDVTALAAASAGPPPVSPGVTLDFFGRSFTLPTDAYLSAFALAFLIGIIFNLVPCVLPVVPIKAMGFYEVSQHNRGKCVALSAVFSAGIVATFAALALLVVVLKTLTWGNQFSNPWFVGAIVIILVVMAVGMFGAFTLRLPTSVYSLTPRHDSLTGNFLLGILTAVLSTPCTAPMFPGLLLWATRQATDLAVAVVIMVGVGMAFPYLVLGTFPELARKLPRAGPWSELVKQMMGFLLLAVAVYFAGGQFLPGHSFVWAVVLVMGAAGVFLIVRTLQLSPRARPISVSVIIVLLAWTATAWGASRLLDVVAWVPYSPAALADARAAHKVAVVEFTANWCPNCLALESTVFHDPRVRAALSRGDVAPLRVDLSGTNPQGRELLGQLDSTGGIPLTAIYPTHGAGSPHQLTSLYSADSLLDAIEQAAH